MPWLLRVTVQTSPGEGEARKAWSVHRVCLQPRARHVSLQAARLLSFPVPLRLRPL